MFNFVPKLYHGFSLKFGKIYKKNTTKNKVFPAKIKAKIKTKKMKNQSRIYQEKYQKNPPKNT
jgi:hypothetical protein